MAPVTEFSAIKLQPGLTPAAIDDGIRKLAEATLAAPGCNGFYTSLVHEDPSRMYMLVDWASLEAQQEFAQQDLYLGLIIELVTACVDPGVPPIGYHVALSPAAPAVLHNNDSRRGATAPSSPAVELLHVYFPPGTAADAEIERQVGRFLGTLDGIEGFSGQTAVGWALEELEYKDGEKCRVLVMGIGWESVAAHERFRDTEAFKEIVPIFMGIPGQKGVEAVHLSTKSW